MTKQTHTVSTDALATLGTIIDENAGRDAIHLAVEPVVAGVYLVPGQDVGLRDGLAVPSRPYVGIVDPFLSKSVNAGDRFWLVVYPRTITSLRHVWSHPSFPEAVEPVVRELTAKEVSEQWLKDWADTTPISLDTIMGGARDYLEDKRNKGWGEYLVFGGLLEGESVPDEFWTHYEVVTGEKVDPDHRGSFFSCAC